MWEDRYNLHVLAFDALAFDIFSCVLTGILLAEVVKHEYTSGLTFKHYAIWCIVLVIGVCVTYFGISILSLDPLWSLTLAKKWCANPEWVHPDTTPFFTFTRDVSSLLGMNHY